MAKKIEPDILSKSVEFIGMAARLAKITMNNIQCEFMFRVATLIMEKGKRTELGEISELYNEVETNSKDRKDSKKRQDNLDQERVFGGDAPTLIEKNIDRIHEKLNGQRKV